MLLVESDPVAARTIRANAIKIGLAGAEVLTEPVERLLAGGSPASPYDVVFLDPPYEVADDAVGVVVSALLDGGWLAARALVVVERATRGGEWQWPAGFESDRSRRYGEATLWYGRAAPQPPGANPTSER